jgi:multiple sugar transport system permease protein
MSTTTAPQDANSDSRSRTATPRGGGRRKPPGTRPGSRRFGFPEAMMLPGIAVLALISIVPTLVLVVMSFSNVHMIGGVRISFAGLANWGRILTDGEFWISWGITILYLVLTIGLELVLGIILAQALHRFARARGMLLPVLLLPMFVAPVIVGLLGRFLTDSTFGLYAQLLQGIGLSGDVLSSGPSAFIAVVLMDVWEWTPLLMLIALAGLTSVNPSVVEAAQLDGASGWRMFRSITLPSISGVLLVGLLIRSMDAIRYFDIITITTNGGPGNATKTAPVRLFETAFRFLDLGYASVTGIFMIVVTIIIARLFIRVLGTKGEVA